MSIVKIDASNTSNFKAKTLIPKGRYVFEVANDLVVAKSKNSSNNKVDVELRCQDEGPAKGSVIFDTLVLSPKTEWKMCHLVLACGTQTEADMKANGVDLALLKGCKLEAEVDVRAPEKGADGTTYGEKNVVKRYIFEPVSA